MDEIFEHVDEIETVLETINESNRVVLSKIPDTYQTKRLIKFALDTASQECSSELNAFDTVTGEMYEYLNGFDNDDTETKETTTHPSLLSRKRSYAPSSSKDKEATMFSSMLILQSVCEEYVSLDKQRNGEKQITTLDFMELNTHHIKRASAALNALAFLSRVAELVVYFVIGNMNQIPSAASVESFVNDTLKRVMTSMTTSPLCKAAFDLSTQDVPFKPSREVLEIVNVIAKVLCEDVQASLETNRLVNFVPCIQFNPDNEKCGRVRCVLSFSLSLSLPLSLTRTRTQVPTRILSNMIRTWTESSLSQDKKTEVICFMIQNLSSVPICVHYLSLEVMNVIDDDVAPMHLSARHINILRIIAPGTQSADKEKKVVVASVTCSRLRSSIWPNDTKENALQSNQGMARSVRGMWSIRFL